MQTFDYMMLAMPFLAVAVCLGLNKMKWKYFGIAVAVVVVSLGIFNANYFNIGVTLDKNMSVATFYKSLSQMSDNAIYIGSPNLPAGTNLALINKYNKDNNQNIREVETDSQDVHSIVASNDNVWVAILKDPLNYNFELVKVNRNVDLIPVKNVIENKIVWHWIPSNPYDIITARLYLTEWQFAIMSQYNFRLLCLIIIPAIYVIRESILQLRKGKVL